MKAKTPRVPPYLVAVRGCSLLVQAEGCPSSEDDEPKAETSATKAAF